MDTTITFTEDEFRLLQLTMANEDYGNDWQNGILLDILRKIGLGHTIYGEQSCDH